tara:strand:+ start:1217 stop:1396 length:180 start_codon:yes stop_codon:yes gene_type:complete
MLKRGVNTFLKTLNSSFKKGKEKKTKLFKTQESFFLAEEERHTHTLTRALIAIDDDDGV